MRFTSHHMAAGAVALLGACSAAVMAGADTPGRIYRCGNEYTNAPVNPQACSVMPAQTITLIQGTRPFGAPSAPAAQAAAPRTKVAPAAALGAPPLGSGASSGTGPGAASPGPVDVKSRDAQQRAILVAELQQTRERHAQLVLEYNDGQPDKVGGEARNHQKYLDRLAGLKAGIARAERDMDSLQRELSRLPSTQAAQP